MQLSSFLPALSLASLVGVALASPVPAPEPAALANENASLTLASRQSSTTDVIIYMGTMMTQMFTDTLDGILDTQSNILYTIDQIGIMATRIVYVTEISQSGAIEVISLVVGLFPLGTGDDGLYAYQAVLVPVLALPAGWLEASGN